MSEASCESEESSEVADTCLALALSVSHKVTKFIDAALEEDAKKKEDRAELKRLEEAERRAEKEAKRKAKKEERKAKAESGAAGSKDTKTTN